MPKSSEKHASQGALNGVTAPPPREPTTVSAPSHRLNIAFPFSQIKLEEPSKELAELAALFDAAALVAHRIPALVRPQPAGGAATGV